MKIGIIGATGAVGLELLKILVNKNNSNYQLYCYASSNSAGKTIEVDTAKILVEEFSLKKTSLCDVIFLCVSGKFSLKYAEKIAKNSFVIDNSSAFRYHDNVPLLVPPVNGHDYAGEKLIANPNCSSAIALVVLAPLHKRYAIEHMIVSTYQAASGAGLSAINELKSNIKNFTDYKENTSSEYFYHNLAFNVIPQVDKFENNRYTKEEMKVVWEIQKVLNSPEMKISTTAVRVPVLRSHAESITLKFKKPVEDIIEVHGLLNNAEGVVVHDDITNSVYPMPATSTYKNAVEVGRIRHNLIYNKYGLDLFVSGDQLLRGAVLNAYEILESILAK